MTDLRDLYKTGDTIHFEVLNWAGEMTHSQELLVLGVRNNRMLTGARAGSRAVVAGAPQIISHDQRIAFWDGQWYSGGPRLAAGSLLDRFAPAQDFDFAIGLPPEFSPKQVQVLALGLNADIDSEMQMQDLDWQSFYDAKMKYDYPWWLEGNVRGAVLGLHGLIEKRAWPFGVYEPSNRPVSAPTSRTNASPQLPDSSVPSTQLP